MLDTQYSILIKDLNKLERHEWATNIHSRLVQYNTYRIKWISQRNLSWKNASQLKAEIEILFGIYRSEKMTKIQFGKFRNTNKQFPQPQSIYKTIERKRRFKEDSIISCFHIWCNIDRNDKKSLISVNANFWLMVNNHNKNESHPYCRIIFALKLREANFPFHIGKKIAHIKQLISFHWLKY